ncbi:MAG: hypothetical protein ABIR32_21105 [Ilumatobacteraceae bacterium]
MLVLASGALGCVATLAVQAITDDNDDQSSATAVRTDAYIELRGHVDPVHSARFSPDGSMVLTAGSDGRLIAWDSRSGEQLQTFGKGGDYVASAQFDSTNSRILAVIDGDGVLFDVESGKKESTIDAADELTSAVLTSRDEAVVAITFAVDSYLDDNGMVTRWNASNGDVIDVVDNGGYPEAISADGELTVVSDADDEGSTTTQIVDVGNGSVLSTLAQVQEFVYYADAAQFSEDGNRIARVTSEYTDDESLDSLTSVWDSNTGRLITTLDDPSSDHVALAFDHDGSVLATTSYGNDYFTSKIVLWDAETGNRIRTVTSEAVGGFAFSPDDSSIAVAMQNSAVTIWDVKSGDQIVTLSGHIGAINSIAFSPNGDRLITASNDGTARIWNLR